MILVVKIFLSLLLASLTEGNGLGVYYGAYRTYPTGDTLIELDHMDGGPVAPDEKWIAECNDGEALVALRDDANDFEALKTMWCKLVFGGKAPVSGYPFYDRCRYRNASASEKQFHCFDPSEPSESFETFVVALREDDAQFRVGDDVHGKRAIGPAFKCCGMPSGYSIDYDGCHLRYTHDEYWEYFDGKYFMVRCPDAHVMAGLGWVTNPYDEDRHWDWIQCCPLRQQRSKSEKKLAIDYKKRYGLDGIDALLGDAFAVAGGTSGQRPPMAMKAPVGQAIAPPRAVRDAAEPLWDWQTGGYAAAAHRESSTRIARHARREQFVKKYFRR